MVHITLTMPSVSSLFCFPLSNYVSMLHHFSDILIYSSKIANFYLPRLYLAPPLGVTPFKFHQDLRHQKNAFHVLLFA